MKLFFVTFFAMFSVLGFSQKVDTLINRPVYALKIVDSSAGSVAVQYSVDGKKVSKKKYDAAVAKGADMQSACKPCWLKNFDAEGNLVQEGMMYGTCLVGKSITYYKTGEVEIVEYYKGITGKSWKNHPCSVLDGTASYYEKDGTVTLTVVYKDGKRME